MYYFTAIIAGLSKLSENARGRYFQNFIQSRILAIKNACEELKNETQNFMASSGTRSDEIIKIVIAPEYFFAPAPAPMVVELDQRIREQNRTFSYLNHAQFVIIKSNLLNLSNLYPDIVIIPGTIPYKKGAPSTIDHTSGSSELTAYENSCENILLLCLQAGQKMRFGITAWESLETILTKLKAELNTLPVNESTDSISLDELSTNPSPAFKKIQNRRHRYHKEPQQIKHNVMTSPTWHLEPVMGDHPLYTKDSETNARLLASLNDKSVNLTNTTNPITYRNSVIAYLTGQVAYNGTKSLGYNEIDPRLLWTNSQYLYGYTPKNAGFAWESNNTFRIGQTLFGIEICYDHWVGVLKKEQLNPDVQVILSDSVRNISSNRTGEFCIHASSFLQYAGVAHKPSQQGERKFLNVKWIYFSYLDLIGKFSKKTPRPLKTFETNDTYNVLLTRSCSALDIGKNPPVCLGIGGRTQLQTADWNDILPQPSGELIYWLAE